MSTVTVSSRGQIVLPKRIRDELSIHEGDRMEIRRDGNRIVLDPAARHPKEKNWRAWRGTLAGTTALEDHLGSSEGAPVRRADPRA